MPENCDILVRLPTEIANKVYDSLHYSDIKGLRAVSRQHRDAATNYVSNYVRIANVQEAVAWMVHGPRISISQQHKGILATLRPMLDVAKATRAMSKRQQCILPPKQSGLFAYIIDGGMYMFVNQEAESTTLWHVSEPEAILQDRLVGSVYYLARTLLKEPTLTVSAVVNMLCYAYSPTQPTSQNKDILSVLARCVLAKVSFKDALPLLCLPMRSTTTNTRFRATPFCHSLILSNLGLGKGVIPDVEITGRGAHAMVLMFMAEANLQHDFSVRFQMQYSQDHVLSSKYDVDVYECRRGWQLCTLLVVLREHTAPLYSNVELRQLYDNVLGAGAYSPSGVLHPYAVYRAVVLSHVFFFTPNSIRHVARFLLSAIQL